jgi:putative serine protease PepD
MSESLLDDVNARTRAPSRDAAPVAPQAKPTSSRPRGPRVAIAVVIASLLGGIAASGLLLVTGALDGSAATTTVIQASGSDAARGAGSPSATRLAALYRSAAPGVVDITARGVSTASSNQSPFGAPQPSQSTATGTGFVVDGAGHIVTAAHVVDGASSITIGFQDGTERTATVVGRDDASDVAVVKIDPSGLTLHPLPLGSSQALGVGDALVAIGDPFGYDRSLSQGIVSGLDRTVDAPNGFTVAHAIQTDAAMNPGNSGGPLLNSSGQVVGVADQIATGGSTDANTGVGFAVPIDLVKSELGALKAGKTPKHAYLGVSTSSAQTSRGGALVGQITAGQPAARAGLHAGDIVVAIGPTQIKDSGTLVSAIAAHAPGDRVTVTVLRSGRTLNPTVTLGSQPLHAPSSIG